MVEACRRTGWSADRFGPLRSEVCFGSTDLNQAAFGLSQDKSICSWYEDQAQTNPHVDHWWNTTVIVGHSQGAGHALMLSQHLAVAGVIMIAGPADAANGELASWTSAASRTPNKKRLLLVHQQDGACREVLAHARQLDLSIKDVSQHQQGKIGGLAFVDTEIVPALSAHGCLAGRQTWSVESERTRRIKQLVHDHFIQWQNTSD